MSTDLVKAEAPPPALAVRYGRPLIDQQTLVEEGQQRQLLMAYVKSHMVEDEDYGVIPGTKRKALLKPGAEKLTDLFRCFPQFDIVQKIEDFDRPLFHYVFRCKIVSRETAQVVAEGYGSCSSHESKYRWRNGDRQCPTCGAAAILRSKFPPKNQPQAQPGWYCYAKKGGCGANFDAADPGITSQTTGRVENPDLADCVNTVLKMAKKRAMVDAAIALARCSDMFTQDVDEGYDDHGPATSQYHEPAPRQAHQQHQQPQSPGGQHQSPPPEPASVKELHDKVQAIAAPESGDRLATLIERVDAQLSRLVPDYGKGDLAESVREFLRVPDVKDIVKVRQQQDLSAAWANVKQYLGREKDAELKRAAESART